jgi:hypothetical protein
MFMKVNRSLKKTPACRAEFVCHTVTGSVYNFTQESPPAAAAEPATFN